MAPDLVANATSAAVAAASSAVDLSCMEIYVVAVEIQTDEKVQEVCTKGRCPWSADWPDTSTGI